LQLKWYFKDNDIEEVEIIDVVEKVLKESYEDEINELD